MNFDENGNGMYQMDQNVPFYPLVYGVDTPPAGGYPTLYYNLPFSPVNEGNLLVLEPTGETSDVLRFVNVDGIARVYIYSDNSDGTDAMADTGIPSPLFVDAHVHEIGGEGYNYAVYEVYGFAIYNFTSDVPEPTTICLLGFGALSLIRRKK